MCFYIILRMWQLMEILLSKSKVLSNIIRVDVKDVSVYLNKTYQIRMVRY